MGYNEQHDIIRRQFTSISIRQVTMTRGETNMKGNNNIFFDNTLLEGRESIRSLVDLILQQCPEIHSLWLKFFLVTSFIIIDYYYHLFLLLHCSSSPYFDIILPLSLPLPLSIHRYMYHHPNRIQPLNEVNLTIPILTADNQPHQTDCRLAIT